MNETKLMNRLARMFLAGLSMLLLGMVGTANAATYNIILKNGAGVAFTCATGGFTFTKTVDGNYTPTGASVNLPANCILSATSAKTLNQAGPPVASQALTVAVITTTVNGQNQGANVEGMNGQLTVRVPARTPDAVRDYIISFSLSGSGATATRSYTLQEIKTSDGSTLRTATGKYYVRNTANPIPEPETLALFLGGLGALGYFAKRRRRV